MDVRINEVHSQVRTNDSQALLDPQVMRQIVKACVAAVNEEQERQRRSASERRLSSAPEQR